MKLLFGLALGVVALGAGAPLAYYLHEVRQHERLAGVVADFRDIQSDIVSYGIDRCGHYHPPDTSLRLAAGEDVPLTFEWENERFQELALAAELSEFTTYWHPITDPVPYMVEIPRDGYAPSEPYGYASLSWGTNEANVGILRSVGPNRRADLDLRRLRVDLAARLEGRRELEPDDLEWLLAQIEPCQWNPKDGFRSSGDIVAIFVNNTLILELDTMEPLRNYVALQKAGRASTTSTSSTREIVRPRTKPNRDSMLTSISIGREMDIARRYPLDALWLKNSFPSEMHSFFEQPHQLNAEQALLVRERLSRHATTHMIWASVRESPIREGRGVNREVYFEYMPIVGKSIILLAAADITDSREDLATRRLDYLDRLLAVGRGSHDEYTDHEEQVFSELRRISRGTRALMEPTDAR